MKKDLGVKPYLFPMPVLKKLKTEVPYEIMETHCKAGDGCRDVCPLSARDGRGKAAGCGA